MKAFAYLRTSSAGNVGFDKDSGADRIDKRPGFVAMLQAIAAGDVRAILVESPDRFARDLAVQLAGHDMLCGLGVDLVPTTSPRHFLEDTPTAVLVRQVLGAIAQFDKASVVARLKAARDRKKALTGKCGGRRSNIEARPDVVALARRMRRLNPKTKKRMSLRKIAADLATAGHVTQGGRPFDAKAIAAMLA